MIVLFSRMRACMGCHTELKNCQVQAPTIFTFQRHGFILEPFQFITIC